MARKRKMKPPKRTAKKLIYERNLREYIRSTHEQVKQISPISVLVLENQLEKLSKFLIEHAVYHMIEERRKTLMDRDIQFSFNKFLDAHQSIEKFSYDLMELAKKMQTVAKSKGVYFSRLDD